MNIIMFLVIGGIAGWIAAMFVKGKGLGLVGNVAVGVVGSVIGGFIFDILKIQGYGLIGSLVTATVGAALLLWAAGRLQKRSSS